MRRDQHEAAHAVVLDIAGINGRDRRSVAVPDQEAAAKADCVEQPRQDGQRLGVHIGHRTRQGRPAGAPIARARIDEDAGPRLRRELFGKVPPHGDRAEPLVQEHERRRLIRLRPDHPILEPRIRNVEKAFLGEGRHRIAPDFEVCDTLTRFSMEKQRLASRSGPAARNRLLS